MTSWSHSGATTFAHSLHPKAGVAHHPERAVQLPKGAESYKECVARDNLSQIVGVALLFPSTNLVYHS